MVLCRSPNHRSQSRHGRQGHAPFQRTEKTGKALARNDLASVLNILAHRLIGLGGVFRIAVEAIQH